MLTFNNLHKSFELLTRTILAAALLLTVSTISAAPRPVKKNAPYSLTTEVKGLPDAAYLPLDPSTPMAAVEDITY